MNFIFKSSIFATAFAFSTTIAHAQVNKPVVIGEPSRKAAQMVENTQYAIEIRCTPRGRDLTDPSDIFVSRNRSLFVLVAPNVPSTADKLPSDLLAAVQVYTIGKDKDTKQQILTDDRECRKDFLVNGSKKVGFVVSDNWIDSFSDSTFGQVLTGAMGLLSPLFSLFTGQTIPTVIAGKITNAGSVQSSMQGILTALGRGVNNTHPPERNLRVGTYVVRSDYAVVRITVRTVPSIVLDKNPAFKDDLKSQINAASVKLDGTKIPTSCRGARYDIFGLGFKSPTDLAYGLSHLSAHAGFDIKDSITCLTPEYAKVAANADGRFWNTFPAEFRINPADLIVPAPPVGQPTWDKVRPTLDSLVVALARYARNDPPPEVATTVLTTLLAPKVAVIDNTTGISIGVIKDPLNRFDAVNVFKAKGYIRFGCYAPTDTNTDQQVDGATSMFLVFKAPSDATVTAIDTALVVRPQFDGAAVKSLAISDNRAWIVATLKNRDYECNGFEVKKGGAEIVH